MKNNAFCRLPKMLFTDERYKNMSGDSKILYAVLLDRSALSEKNGWVDKDGATYLYFTNTEAMELLNIGRDKCVRVFAELTGAGLIKRKKQGLGKPALIYIADICPSQNTDSDSLKSGSQEKAKMRSPEALNEEPNNKNINKNNNNDTDITTLSSFKREEGLMREIIKENIDYNSLVSENGREAVDRIVELMTETVMTKTGNAVINGISLPYGAVSSRLLKLGAGHIGYVIERLKSVSGVKNIRGYTLSMLYNSYTTAGTYYGAEHQSTAGNVREYELKPTSAEGSPGRQKGSSNFSFSSEREDDEYACFINRSF